MAVNKFINGENKTYKGLREVLKYIKNPEKTTPHLIFGLNCDHENDYDEFVAIKHIFNKEEGRQYIHFTQSFSPSDNITPELVHEVGKKLLEFETFKGFQVVMATHTDREHLHNHFVINTVNAETGKKWKQSRSALAELKDYSDEICLSCGLSIIDEESKGYKSSGEYKSTKEERSWKHELCLAVNECKFSSTSTNEFISNMKKLNYHVSWDYGGESDEIKKISSVISVCLKNSDSESDLKLNLQHYGYDMAWSFKLKMIEQKKDSNEPVLSEVFYKTKRELDKHISSLDSQVAYEWTDDIKFKTPEGHILTPDSFEKQGMFSGNTIRSAFEINVQNEKKPLPNIEDIPLPKTSNESKKLFLIVKACKQHSVSKEDFIDKMKTLGYRVKWEDHHKYITFITPTNHKVRNRSLQPAKQFTKEAFQDTFEFNTRMKAIVDAAKVTTVEELIDSATRQGCKLTYDKKKQRYNFEMSEDKKCYLNEDIVEAMKKVKGVIKLPSEDDILSPLKIETIMFTTPDGKKCSNKQLFPSSKYTKGALLAQFDHNKAFEDLKVLQNRMSLLQTILYKLQSDDSLGNETARAFPLSHLEGQALKEKALQLAKGKGFSWDHENGHEQ